MVREKNLERTRKVREKSGILKINGYGSFQKKTIHSVHWRLMYFLMRQSKPTTLLIGGHS